MIAVVILALADSDRRGVVAARARRDRRRDPERDSADVPADPREERFFDLFEEQGRNIVAARGTAPPDDLRLLRRPGEGAWRSRSSEHAGDVLTHELIRKINTTFITPFDREDVYALALAARRRPRPDRGGRETRLVLYRIKEPTSGARAFADVIVKTASSVQAAVGCLRASSKVYHTHCVEVNRLENEADRLLKELIAALFADVTDPIEVIKWKEIYETSRRSLTGARTS